jgi:serine protease Do
MALLLPLPGAPAMAQGPAEAQLPELVERLMPTVVSIITYWLEPTKPDPAQPNLAPMTRHRAVGSGFIVDGSGLIATADHVIRKAQKIIVVMHDGTTYPGRVVYQAPVDIALVQIDAGRPLHVVRFGDSNAMKPGDGVLSIGNPLGLGFTATRGILSALDRDLKESDSDAFMQTDASINQGNSGGPLWNLRGEVIGQTNAILTTSNTGGSVGLGFIMPGNEVKFVVDQFQRYGRVRLGWLGAEVQTVTQHLAQALGLPEARGVLVQSVAPDSPAAAAKLRDGDVILSIDGRRTDNSRWYNRVVGSTPVDVRVQVEYIRDRAITSIDVAWTESPLTANAKPTPVPPPMNVDHGLFGVTLWPVDDAARAKFKLPAKATGMVVTSVVPYTAADDLGVEVGDVLVKVGQTPIASEADLRTAVNAAIAARQPRMLVLLSTAKGMRWVAPRTPAKSVP